MERRRADSEGRRTRCLVGCQLKRKEWAKHWQCDTEVRNLEDKPCRNEELKNLEEDMPRLKESDLEKTAGEDRDAMAFIQSVVGFDTCAYDDSLMGSPAGGRGCGMATEIWR